MKQLNNVNSQNRYVELTQYELVALTSYVRRRLKAMVEANDRASKSSFESSSEQPVSLPYTEGQLRFWDELLYQLVSNLTKPDSE